MDKQKILNVLIVIAVIAIIVIVGWIIYDQKSNNEVENTISINNAQNEQNKQQIEVEEPVVEELENSKEEEEVTTESKEPEYIGKEEVDSKEETTEKTPEEKAIELAKQTWGEDKDVIYSLEEKKGKIYYVAVKSNASVLLWYEINTETWEISEFY